MASKKTVRVVLFRKEQHDLPGTFSGMQHILNEATRLCPDEFLDTLYFDWDTEYRYHYDENDRFYLEVSYLRPETEEEKKARELKYLQDSKAKEAQQRHQYEKLKAIYEGKTGKW